jgi:hypothetical protein
MVVGEKKFYASEASGRCGLEAIEEGQFGEHEGEVGGESRHDDSCFALRES